MSEAGFPEFDASTWYGLVGPGKMPAALAQRMNDDVNKVLSMPDVMERLDQYGAEDSGGTREKFAEFIRSERQTWGKVIKDAKVTTES
jgi:tripartite-type tricarboxylate transporter receptor subunit TctC